MWFAIRQAKKDKTLDVDRETSFSTPHAPRAGDTVLGMQSDADEPLDHDQVVLRAVDWVWSGLMPHTRYLIRVVPLDAAVGFDCHLRYSDLLKLEAHATIRAARLQDAATLPTMPSAHRVPLVGKLMDSTGTSWMRGVDIQLYLQGLLRTGGGVRTTTLEVLAKHAVLEFG